MKIVGVDFTSAPKPAKPIVVAECEASQATLALVRFLEFSDWPAYEQWLRADEEWIGGFDFPFGLPRRFVRAQGWPMNWRGMVEACVKAGKERFVREAMRAFQAAKQKSDKHRATDLAAGSESPLKTNANPPVGRMFYEGAWRLLANGIHIPGLNQTGSRKVALEAFPGFLVSGVGERYYKNDKPTSAEKNAAARKRIVSCLTGQSNSRSTCTLKVASRSLREKLHHASGDWLDAVLCAVQAHWGWSRKDANFGLPADIDPIEGWIVTS